MTIVVTGGAGYIGAHVVRLLQQAGDKVVIVDDLSTGDASRVGGAPIIELDIAQPEAKDQLSTLLREVGATAVIHFAARKQVGESVARPVWYFEQNVGGMANLLAAMEQASVSRLVFSSSAAAYGQPDVGIVSEKSPAVPINPYGQTKLACEWLASDAATAWGLRVVALRYFNVAGAGVPELGDPAALNLVPMVLEKLAAGRRPLIFGDDYPTPDGTCVRDYIHVSDLARAHIDSLNYLERNDRPYDVFNVGTGEGSSVREVIAEIGRVSGLDVAPEILPRRPGDPAELVGDPTRINDVLGWRAEFGLPDIIASAWEAWQAGPHRIEI
ncbi:UDP-glucose 4-epimerase GalE [Rarobacter faecitabidus]|uniref:UDP-glucose 4-epimerase n=1 Tax=Rarobacter faecitabidus TaxID=13243 RepID=A0A542ZU54_RARFA|nr:UDP-glucose 4-epimerase GalE [Rarobacter faecitabidus]TQL63819.1 UDP-glucose 4-epimerase [Rarobacter faecitabidus]